MSGRSILADFIQEKHAEPAFAELLLGLSDDAVSVVQQLIQTLSPSANTLRGYLELAREIGKRDELSPHAVLGATEVLKILAHDGWSKKEKQKRVRDHLEMIRYPWRAARERSIAEIVSKIRREFGVALECPEDLEGDALTLSLSFRSKEELQALADRLSAVATSADLDKLFGLLTGKE